MSYSTNTGFTIRNKPDIKLVINANANGLKNSIINILYNCSLTAFGYDTSNDTYWGKNKSGFHFIMKIQYYDFNETRIEISIVQDNKTKSNTINFTSKLMKQVMNL
jgi:hypothetical protein